MNSIFVLQVRRTLDKRNENYREVRNIGWFDTMDNAEVCLKANSSIFSDDGYYPIAVIEEVPEGPYSIGMYLENGNTKWFKLEGDKSCEHFNAVYVDAPELAKDGVIGYTMG